MWHRELTRSLSRLCEYSLSQNASMQRSIERGNRCEFVEYYFGDSVPSCDWYACDYWFMNLWSRSFCRLYRSTLGMLRDWWHEACVRRSSQGPMKCRALFSRMWSVQGNIFENFLGNFYQFFNLNTVVTVGGDRDVYVEWLESEEDAFSLASWDFREHSRAISLFGKEHVSP